MKAILLPLAVMASVAAAQTSSACGADYIVEACLTSETAKLNNCGEGDYDCKCQNWVNIITCYNNCPNDPRQHAASGQRDIFCGYASQFPSSTTTQTTATSTSAPAETTEPSNRNQDDSTVTGSDSATTTTTGDSPTNTNSAADLALNAGGVLAAVAGVMAVIL